MQTAINTQPSDQPKPIRTQTTRQVAGRVIADQQNKNRHKDKQSETKPHQTTITKNPTKPQPDSQTNVCLDCIAF